MKISVEKTVNFKELKQNEKMVLVPNDYNKVVIKEILSKNPKSKLKAGSLCSIGEFPAFNCSNEQKYFSDISLVSGENLFLSTGGVASVSYLNGNAAYSTDVLSLKTYNNNYSLKYIYYYLYKNINKLNSFFYGSGLKHLNKNDFFDLEVSVPPIQTQTNIEKILDVQFSIIKKYNDFLNNVNKTIKNSNDLFIFGKNRIKLSEEKEKELLSKDVISLVEEKAEKEQFSFFNINEGKFEEFVSLVDLTKDIVFYQNDEANWKTEEVNELQKQLPKDWNVEQLCKKVNFIKGKSIPENQLNYNGEGLKYLKTTEFWLDSSSKRDTVHYAGKVEEKYMKQKDEYVFSMDGFNNKIGQGTLGLISNEDEGIVSTSFYKLEKNDIYHLVVNVLKSTYVQNFIMRLGEGTTVYHAGKYMKNLQGVFPKSTVEQKLLSMIFEKEEKLVDSLKEKIKLEEKVFKYLQQELLSGRIRIKVEE